MTSDPKSVAYRSAHQRIASLLGELGDPIAAMASVAAVLIDALPTASWGGSPMLRVPSQATPLLWEVFHADRVTPWSELQVAILAMESNANATEVERRTGGLWRGWAVICGGSTQCSRNCAGIHRETAPPRHSPEGGEGFPTP